MARKPDAAKAKAAKQKKMLIVLSGVLVLALLYAFMTVRGLNKGSSAAPPPVTTSTTATTTPATTTTPAATPAPGTLAAPTLGAAAATSTVSAAPLTLVAAAKPAPGTGQLESFSRFASKDPFDASGPKETSSPSGGGSSGGGGAAAANPSGAATGSGSSRPPTGGGVTAASSPGGAATSTTAQQPPPVSAVVAVNGVAGLVAVGADFPASSDPVQNGIFHLLALTQTTAEVTVVGGSYASGSPTLTLKVNRPVTLVNTADGKRYTLQLFPQGTAPPAGAATAPTTSTAP